MLLKRIFLLSLLTFVASACAKTTTIRHSGNYDSVIARSNKVAVILPPDVEVNMVELSGKKKRAYDYELHLESIIIDELIPALKEQGIQPLFLSRKHLHEQNLTAANARTRDRYKEIRELLYKEILWKEEKAFNVNESVGLISQEIGAKNNGDLIMIIDFARDVKSSGARTADILIDLISRSNRSAEADKSVLIIGILDAKTGKFLWSNLTINLRDAIASSFDNNTHEDKLMQQKINLMLKNIFKKFKETNNSDR